MAGIFQPDPLNYLFGSGIGTNLGAALVWIPIGGVLGVLWSKTKYWPLNAIHAKLDHLHASHEALHAKLDHLHESHRELHEKLDALEKKP